MNTISFAIITCKESYASLFKTGSLQGFLEWEKNKSTDLYGAQKILLCIRHALGHFKAPNKSLDAFGEWDFWHKKNENQYPNGLKISSLDVSIDTFTLHKQRFDWSHLGGVGNFLKILKFLEKDLESRLA